MKQQSYRLDTPWGAYYNVRAAVCTLQRFNVLRLVDTSIEDCNSRLLCHRLIEPIELTGYLQVHSQNIQIHSGTAEGTGHDEIRID